MSTSGGVAAVIQHNTTAPNAPVNQFSAGLVTCGLDPALPKIWGYNSFGLFQNDTLSGAAVNFFAALNTPANVSPVGQEAKIVTFTPSTGANAGTKLMFLLSWNTSTSRYEVYSAPPAAKGVAVTWTGPILQLQANATMIPNAFTATSAGIFVGEYSGGADITGTVKVYKIALDGSTVTTVLSLTSGAGGTRHIHAVAEDRYNLGTIYITVGDFTSPYVPPFGLYKSTNGGTSFAGVPGFTSGTWQAVSIDFTRANVILGSDQVTGGGSIIFNRVTMSPRWLTTEPTPPNIAVPGARGGRYVGDWTTVNASNVATSATAAFTSFDVGAFIEGNNAVPVGTFIASVTNSTTVVMSQVATGTTAAPTLIAGDCFYSSAYEGVVDPLTDFWYLAANDASNAGTTGGIFVCVAPGQPYTLIQPLPLAQIGHHQMYQGGGFYWIDRYGPFPLWTKPTT